MESPRRSVSRLSRISERVHSPNTLAEMEQKEAVERLEALKDSKRAWLVCFAAFLIQVVIVGVLHVFGVFFVALIDEFHSSKAATGQDRNSKSDY